MFPRQKLPLVLGAVLFSASLHADSTISGPFDPYPDGTNQYAADTGGTVFHHPNTSSTGQCVWFVRAVRPDGTELSSRSGPASEGFTTSGMAHNIYLNAQRDGFTVGSTPKKGAIMCFRKELPGSGGAGHVAIVAGVDGDDVIVWDSNFGSPAEKVRKRRVNTTKTYLQGYIYRKGGSDAPPGMFPDDQNYNPTATWVNPPAQNRWYRSDEYLEYNVSGGGAAEWWAEEWVNHNRTGFYRNITSGHLRLSYAGSEGWHKYEASSLITSPSEKRAWTGGWYGGYDVTAPTASQSGGAAKDQWHSGSPSVSWTTSDVASGVKRFWYKWGDGGWQGPFDGSQGSAAVPEGSHRLYVRAEDKTYNGGDYNGNVGDSDLGMFKRDTQVPSQPALSFDPPSPGGKASIEVTLSSSDSASQVEKIELYVDGVKIGEINGPNAMLAGSITWNTSGYTTSGTHTILAKAKDVAGNWSESSTTYEIDRDPPVVTMNLNPLKPNGQRGWYKNAPTLEIAASAPSGISAIHYKIGQSPEALYDGPVLLTRQGEYTVRAYAISNTGVQGETVSMTVKIDRSKPLPPDLVDDGSTTPSTRALNFTIANLDEQSGIYRMEYRLGVPGETGKYFSTRGETTSTGFIILDGLEIPEGETVILTARQMNGAGVWSEWASSDGIRIAPNEYPHQLGTTTFSTVAGLTMDEIAGVLSELGLLALGMSSLDNDHAWSGWIASMTGQLSRMEIGLEDWQPSPAGLPAKVELWRNGTLVQTIDSVIIVDSTGPAVKVEAAIADVYDVRVKADRWLSTLVAGVNFRQDLTLVGLGTLLNGDVDGNNVVDTDDRRIVFAANNSRPGDPNWDHRADLNGDGKVNQFDRAIVNRNMGQAGT